MTAKEFYCTTPQQSEVLLKAGLSPDTADMYWARLKDNDGVPYEHKLPFLIARGSWSELLSDYAGRMNVQPVPCWSFGRLQSLIMAHNGNTDNSPKAIGETLVWSLCSLIINQKEQEAQQ